MEKPQKKYPEEIEKLISSGQLILDPFIDEDLEIAYLLRECFESIDFTKFYGIDAINLIVGLGDAFKNQDLNEVKRIADEFFKKNVSIVDQAIESGRMHKD